MNIPKKITSFNLKIIAVITMFIDHVAATVWLQLIYASYNIDKLKESSGILKRVLQWIYKNNDLSIEIYDNMRIIGRCAFPIYCFLIVEGFIHTRNVGKYAIRLFIFAIISEIPFDMAFNKTIFEIGYNNVFFTLLLGLLMIWALSSIYKLGDKYKEKESKINGKNIIINIIIVLSAVIILISGGLVAEKIIASDYGMSGVVCIFVMFLAKKNKLVEFILGVIALTIVSNVSMEIYALFMIIPIFFYGGEKGKSMKYFFYVFYPAHILILSVICRVLGI